MAERKVDFVALHDHGLQINSNLAKGQYCPHWTSGETMQHACPEMGGPRDEVVCGARNGRQQRGPDA